MVDRLVQQAINQVLMPHYERKFSSTSFGFRPRKGCHDALRKAQKIVEKRLHLRCKFRRIGQNPP